MYENLAITSRVSTVLLSIHILGELRQSKTLVILLGLFAVFVFASCNTRATNDAGDLQFELRGVVSDGVKGLPDARVRVKGRTQFVLTDREGRFCLLNASDGARVTAAKEGYIIQGTTTNREPQEIILRTLPEHDNDSYPWVDPRPNPAESDNCANCHTEIYQQWQGGGHARGVQNRRFMNLYDGSDWLGRPDKSWNLSSDYPNGVPVCTPCHAPSVSLKDQAFDDLRFANAVDAQGVHCDFCHKVRDVSEVGTIGITHGRFGMELLRPSKGQLFFGPLDDVDRGEDSFASVYKDSRFCASCHEGTIFGVHVYSTYSEWLDSPANNRGQHCQSCHMVPDGEMTNVATDFGGIERGPASLASHRLFGDSFKELLESCVDIQVDVFRTAQARELRVVLTATKVGHRVPTGYIDRHMILLVDATDTHGSVVQIKDGPVLTNPGESTLRGRPGMLFAKLLFGPGGKTPIAFWHEHQRIEDTRLVPEQPVVAHFRYPLGVKSIRVRLIYRKFWRDVAKAKGWPDEEIVIYDRLFD